MIIDNIFKEKENLELSKRHIIKADAITTKLLTDELHAKLELFYT